MEKITKSNNSENSFEKQYEKISNQEIISIIQQRIHFMPEAVSAAISEAIKRGIINHPDDINKPEFDPRPVEPRSVFPLGTSAKYTFAIFKSLCRIFYAMGLLPFLYGIFQLTAAKYQSGIIGLAIALVLFAIVRRLEKTLHPVFANIMLAINIPVIVFVVYYILIKAEKSAMDIFALGIIVLVLLYITFYIKKIVTYFNNNNIKPNS